MARSTEEIKKEMTDAWLKDTVLMDAIGLDAETNTKTWGEVFSKVSISNTIVNVVASAIHVLEGLFDRHLEECQDIISKRAHTLAWYREQALAFEYGVPLSNDTLSFNNEGLTDKEIEDSMIVKKCSCTSVESNYPTIQIKAVKADGPLVGGELTKFTSYMKEVADAGVRLSIVSNNPDKVALKISVWYDPLVMDENGQLYIGEGEKPIVEQAIEDYLNNLEFNGFFYPQLLEAYILRQRGIKMVKVERAYSVDYAVEIGNVYQPVSGAIVYDDTQSGYGIQYLNFNDTYNG